MDSLPPVGGSGQTLMAEDSHNFALATGVVILAAGASTRMGRPKMLLPWGATSLLGHLIGQWRGIQARQIAVVVAAGADAIASELDRIGFSARHRIRNPEPEKGMFSSIQHAAAWDGWDALLTHFVIVLGDQPHLSSETLQAISRFASAHRGNICQPARRGRPRHPVVLPAEIFRQLAVAPVEDMRQFLRMNADRVALCELEDDGLDLDIDAPADYERVRSLYAAGGPGNSH